MLPAKEIFSDEFRLVEIRKKKKRLSSFCWILARFCRNHCWRHFGKKKKKKSKVLELKEIETLGGTIEKIEILVAELKIATNFRGWTVLFPFFSLFFWSPASLNLSEKRSWLIFGRRRRGFAGFRRILASFLDFARITIEGILEKKKSKMSELKEIETLVTELKNHCQLQGSKQYFSHNIFDMLNRHNDNL